MFNPTPQQASIFSTALSPLTSNIAVWAVAGSGKTTTNCELVKLIPPRNPETFMQTSICMVAFNKLIADTLKTRVPAHVSCSTFHSLGYKVLRDSGAIPARPPRDFVNGRKCAKYVYNQLDRDDPDVLPTIKLIDLCKNQPEPLVSVSQTSLLIDDFCARFDIVLENPNDIPSVVFNAIERAEKDTSSIDYNDMQCLPIWRGLPFPQYDWVLVDESQDLNSLQEEIVARLLSPTSRLVIVGDPNQAIYGFRGASADSMQHMIERFSCTVMPLSISWRCPKKVVEEARKWLQ